MRTQSTYMILLNNRVRILTRKLKMYKTLHNGYKINNICVCFNIYNIFYYDREYIFDEIFLNYLKNSYIYVCV